MIEPIDPSESNPTKKTGRVPDKARFEKELKVDKPDEVYFDEPRKRKYKSAEEEISSKSPLYDKQYYQSKKPEDITDESKLAAFKTDSAADKTLPPQVQDDGKTPIDTSFYKKDPSSANPPGWGGEEEMPPDPTKGRVEGSYTPTPTLSQEEYERYQMEHSLAEQVKASEKEEQATKQTAVSKELEQEKIAKKQKKEREARTQTKVESSALKQSEEKQVAKRASEIKLEKEGYNPFADKKHKDTSEITTATSQHGLVVDSASQAQATTAAHGAASLLSPEASQLFDKMIGTLIQMSKDGIDQTQLILNSVNFASSVFFDSSIVIDRYATAPNSFNIRLVSPNQQAVVLFSENLSQLQLAFQNSKLGFKLGRLEAEHEIRAPLFKRKKPIGEESGEQT